MAARSSPPSSPSAYAVSLGSSDGIRGSFIGVSLRPIGRKLPAQPAHGSVNQKAHVADRERGNSGNLLVAESMLELQPHDLLLVRRQPVDHAQDRRPGLRAFEL